MSDNAIATTQSLLSMRANATQQALATEMVRQQADSEQAVVALLQKSVEQNRATLPAGQGGAVDVTV